MLGLDAALFWGVAGILATLLVSFPAARFLHRLRREMKVRSRAKRLRATGLHSSMVSHDPSKVPDFNDLVYYNRITLPTLYDSLTVEERIQLLDDLGQLIWKHASTPMARQLLQGLYAEGALQIEGVPRQKH